MIHVGNSSRSRIISKGISAGKSLNCYRGLVQVQPSAQNCRNFSQSDSMLIGDQAGPNTYPYIQVKNPTARVEHEATRQRLGKVNYFLSNKGALIQRKLWLQSLVGFVGMSLRSCLWSLQLRSTSI
ncbi:hypothetical protein O6H91_Y027900 [Diphasiastrum complanatum]|nr:hypothetical protein O6H91_Y027900 [Diphasiastrum complanatum]